MRRRLPTIISLLSLVVLVIIQVYIISSYYEVKSKNYDLTYSKAILTIIENKGYNFTVDTLDIKLNEAAYRLLKEKQDIINPSFQHKILVVFDSLLKKCDTNREKIKNYLIDYKLDSLFQTQFIIKEISFIEINNKIQVYKSNKNFNQIPKPKGLFIKSYTKEGDYYTIQYDYFIDLTHKRKVIFSEMKGLLTLILVTISAVILTFVYTLVTLQRQKKLSELKDDFINNITHEFKTPLSIISVANASLKEHKIQNDTKKFAEICNALEKQNKLLSKMIDNVIDVSLLDRRTTYSQKESVPVKQYLNELIAMFASNESNGKSIQIFEEYLIADNFEYILDPVQFARAINNLLNNSIKYCERKPVIKVRVSLDNQLRIEIEDNGIGIKEEHKKNVFNKFYRVDRSSNVKGLGLGLYIVKRIMENHHGTICLESIWNKGTTVLITLPKSSV